MMRERMIHMRFVTQVANCESDLACPLPLCKRKQTRDEGKVDGTQLQGTLWIRRMPFVFRVAMEGVVLQV
jgi:hypothetical protein